MKKSSKNKSTATSPLAILGGISADEFLREYWQKKPLLIRAAIKDFDGLLSANELAGLACEDDVQSRLVSFKKGSWKLEQGPFDERDFAKLPTSDWTLLVQGVNHHLDEAANLLKRFDFIPHARLDDLMVSYAPDGGGVGPHFDSYDVFLLQGMGRRRWRVSQQKDLSLVEGAPLRILKNFDTEQEWVLEAGDMLYLPPHVAHWGIAEGECMTYSIGFRAPSAQELALEFLSFMQDRIQLSGMYADPDLEWQLHPSEIPLQMIEQVSSILSSIVWKQSDVAAFLGSYLSEPKPDVVFELPQGMSELTFSKRIMKDGIALALKSQLLGSAGHFYLNGEQLQIADSEFCLLQTLADARQIEPEELRGMNISKLAIDKLFAWYQSGYLQFLKS